MSKTSYEMKMFTGGLKWSKDLQEIDSAHQQADALRLKLDKLLDLHATCMEMIWDGQNRLNDIREKIRKKIPLTEEEKVQAQIIIDYIHKAKEKLNAYPLDDLIKEYESKSQQLEPQQNAIGVTVR